MRVTNGSKSWLQCSYRVRYAEAGEDIFKLPGWRTQRYRLWVVDVGAAGGTVRINGKAYRRSNSSVGVYAPGTIYEENLEVGRLTSWSWLLIEEKGGPSLLKRITGDTGFCILSDPGQSIRKKIVEFVDIAKGSFPGRSFLLAALLNHVLGLIFVLHSKHQNEKTKITAGGEQGHPWRKALLTLLEQSSYPAITSKQLANELGISQSTLTHQYRPLCGESFQETIDRWRVEKTCALLIRKDLSIKEIATRVGLSYQSYLSSLFKAVTGYTPSEYRKLI